MKKSFETENSVTNWLRRFRTGKSCCRKESGVGEREEMREGGREGTRGRGSTYLWRGVPRGCQRGIFAGKTAAEYSAPMCHVGGACGSGSLRATSSGLVRMRRELENILAGGGEDDGTGERCQLVKSPLVVFSVPPVIPSLLFSTLGRRGRDQLL